MFGFTKSTILFCGGLVAAPIGCGSGYDLAPVRGRVTCEGQPVPGGSIQFSPIGESDADGGPSAGGEIDENGNYTLTTFGGSDGAIVGRHRILFIRPSVSDIGEDLKDLEELANDPRDPEAAEEAAEEKASLEAARKVASLPCNAPDQPEVTVVAGDNVIDIELVKGERERDEDED